jgi:short-subunit dehydrogenase
MNKVAFITGASSGFGREFARRLAADGYAVGVTARRADRLDSLVEEITTAGGRALASVCDVSERERVHAAIARTVEAFGPVDLLIANAGMSEMSEAVGFDAAAFERVVRVNLLGAAYAVEVVLPGMLDRRSGQLVCIGSLAGYSGLPKSAAYSASKAAVHNMFESLRIDLRGSGVDVTVITPGYVRSELTDQADHPMPFLLELDDAVTRMMRAIHRRRRRYSFPRPLSTFVWAVRFLPRGVYDWIGSRISREKKR